MARKLVLAMLCAAVAVVAARELPAVTVADLPQQLQQLNARLASVASVASKTSSTDLLEYYYKNEKSAYYEPKDKYDEPKEKYDEPKDNYYEPKDKYYEPKDKYYEPKDKYYEHKDKYYEPKEKYYEPKEKYYEPKETAYGYGSHKIVAKLYEKYRSPLRAQDTNADTFQFTSELTCQNPKEKDYYPEHEDGIINIPIVPEHTKIVTVGVCEWTVSKVQEQAVTSEAKLKGNTQVVCTFNKEAEEHCKHGKVLSKGLTLAGQGLVYEFEQEKGGEMDVYLSIINSVVNAEHFKVDTGAIQYFFGSEDGKKEGKDDPTGELTLVFKN